MDHSYQPPVTNQLTEILRERIRNNYYSAASRFPSESELCREFNVSRATVRTALAALAAMGLLLKRPGLGTFLTPSHATQSDDKPVYDLKVAIIMAGSALDGGWNTLGFNGLEKLKAEGFHTAHAENIAQDDITPTTRKFAEAGYDLIIGHGWQFAQPFLAIAPQYPLLKFFVTSRFPQNDIPENLLFLEIPNEYAGYMAGALAALVSNTHIIGFVGGGDNPIQNCFSRAFKLGAEDTVPHTTSLSIITGEYNNAAKGRQAAIALINKGADILWHAADLTGLGVIAAAVERNIKIIGHYSDQTSMAYQSFLTSIYQDIGNIIHNRAHAALDGSFAGGCNWTPPFDHVFRFVAGRDDTPYVDANVSADVQAQMEKIIARLRDGSIHIPVSVWD